jgi:hypothetical protein
MCQNVLNPKERMNLDSKPSQKTEKLNLSPSQNPIGDGAEINVNH